MAKDKKAIQIYTDWRHAMNTMPDELAGKLFKQILNYCNENGHEYPDPEDVMLNAVWQGYKTILKRDLKQWEKNKEIRTAAGKKGSDARWQKIANDGKRMNGIANDGKNAVKVKVKDINTTYLIQTVDADVKNTVDNTQFFKHLKDNPQQQWIEQLYMACRIQTGRMGKLLKLFDQHTKIQQVQHPNFGEFQNHFVSWVRKQEQIGKLKQYQI